MILILEDNAGKLANLLTRYDQRIRGETVIIADTVTKAQYAVQKLLADGEPYELWLDGEVIGGYGIQLFDWLCDNGYKPSYLLVISLGFRSKETIVAKALAENIPHAVWAGPFG